MLLSCLNRIVSADTTIRTSSKAPSYSINLPFRPPPQMLLPPLPTTNNRQHHSFTPSSMPYTPAAVSFPAHTFPQPTPTNSSTPFPISEGNFYSGNIHTNPTNDSDSLKMVTSGSEFRKYFFHTIYLKYFLSYSALLSLPMF